MELIRNFCIIAHVDHGKSTLADRLLEQTGTISAKEMQEQLLDDMELERERGITIKSHPIQMRYSYQAATYTLNLIDTPGHVDFSYEVSRAIAACEGAILLIDASQGVEAQTIANMYLALEQELTIIPVLNKIDLPHADVEGVTKEVVELLGCSPEAIIPVSAKKNIGIKKLLEQVIETIPPPKGDPEAALQAMVFDGVYNAYKGVEVYFRICQGRLNKGDKVCFLHKPTNYRVEELGSFTRNRLPKSSLSAGEVGYFTANIKSAKEVEIGATLTQADRPCEEAVKGFSEVKPMLFAGLYPVLSSAYEQLKSTLEKLQLNDPSLVFEPETSEALGFGFRCGFLGLLHMEIIQERLTREFNMDVINTVPSVAFKVTLQDGSVKWIHAPSQLPPLSQVKAIAEPIMVIQIITKEDCLGAIIELCVNRRGRLINQHFITTKRIELSFEIPLSAIVFDFFDKLKTLSRGYASLDYRLKGYSASDLVRVDILLNNQRVDALSSIVHREGAHTFGKKLCRKLKELLPRHMFEIPIQAAIGGKIIARETIKAKRKDVTAKCYGGDITRKRKLLEKQKKGKERMRHIAGNVKVTQEVFLSVLKLND